MKEKKKIKLEEKKILKKEMKLNIFLSNKYIIAIICLFVDIVLFFSLNFVFNLIMHMGDMFKSAENLDKMLNNMSVYIYEFESKYIIIYMLFFIALSLADLKIVYTLRISYKSLIKGQKGVARWTTFKEIRQQYKQVPLKKESFDGKGGLPVAEYKNKIFIDDSPVNNLIIGLTRSGKGEMFVFKMIDIYSRAKDKASLIITDPKLELAPSCKETLEKRGYDVHVLNLSNPKYSMGYNPLKLIIDAYKKRKYAEAESLCSTFCYSIFNPDESSKEGKFWANTSTFLLSALIMAHIEDCLEEDKRQNKIIEKEYNERREKYLRLSKDEQIEIKNKQHKLKKMQDELEETEDVVEETFIRKNIKELEEELQEYIFEEEIQLTNENEKKINMYSIITNFSLLANSKDEETGELALDIYFNSRADDNRAKQMYSACGLAGGENKGTIFANTLASLNLFTYIDNAKMTAESSIDLSDIGYGNKPIAIFISMPDYDKSNHFIASVFIRQLYFVLSKKASCMPNGKCKREVVFILDEFGNMPTIENMAGLITVCLGRNIRFNLIIQAYSQLKSIYKDDSATIEGNCGNHVYIQTEDIETAEKYAKIIGKKTITNINRTGTKMSLNKSFSESVEERELLNPNELMNLMEGQCIVVRAMKRKNLKGEDIISNPIYNKNKTKLKLRHTYMLDDFPSGNVWSELKEIENTNGIDLEKRIFDAREFMNTLEERQELLEEEKQQQEYKEKRYNTIKKINITLANNYEELLDEIIKVHQLNNTKYILEKENLMKCTIEETVNICNKLNIDKEKINIFLEDLIM